MPVHVVRQGECVESIAFARGLAWKTVWEHAENDELRTRRRAPTELMPGDTLFVPDRQLRDVSCKTDARHRFRRKGVPSRIEVQFLDEAGEPRTGPFELEIAGAITTTGELAEGWVREWISPDVREATIRIRSEEIHEIEADEADEAELEDEFDDRPGARNPDDGGPLRAAQAPTNSWEAHHICLGHLNPIDDLTGTQGRLANLGFYGDAIDGKPSEQLELAIAYFQASEQLDPTGVLDDQTKSALAKAAGDS